MALALPARATRRLIMQKARSHPEKGLLQLEGAWFQVLFHSPRGVLFTFPSRYSFAIGRWLVFSLGGWALRIRTGFHVSRPTWDPCSGKGGFAHGAVTLCGATFQTLALAPPASCAGPATPGGRPPGLGYVRLRSPLLTESMFLSFPPATEMFHFAGSRAPPPWIHGGAASGWMPGCPIRKSTDQRPHASPRGLSQLAASFLACRRQGIRHAPVQPGRQIHGARRGRPGGTGPLLSLLPGRALGGRAPRFCC